MDRRNFMRLGLGASSLGKAAGMDLNAAGRSKEKDAHSWTLANQYLEITLGAEAQGGLVSFVDVKTRRNFVASKPRPLYDLLLFEKGRDVLVLSSRDAETFHVERSSSPQEESLTLTYGPHHSLDLRVTCKAVLEPNSSLSQWRISITNNTSYGIRALRYPIMVAPSILGESDDDDYFMLGRGGGSLTHQPAKREKRVNCECEDQKLPDRAKFRADGGRGRSWIPIQYPGPIGVQLQAYYDDSAGLYMATYDPAGNTKSFGITQLHDGLEVSIEHNYDERPGTNFELPYDTIFGVFHGDWYTCADIYKEWASRQHWCAKKVSERMDLPGWLKEPRPWMAIISAGPYERLRGSINLNPADYPNGKFWPASKVVPLMRTCAFILNTPVVTWMEGWEKTGAPGGPDVFPPLEGEESFKAAMEGLDRDGNFPFMYLAGIHWTYKMPHTGYNNWELFEQRGRKMAALDDHGELIISDIARRTYSDGQKYFASLCTGSREMQDLWIKNYMHLMALGAVALQMDQQVGFYAQVCYGDQHGHSPGYGPWMYQRTAEFIRQVRRAAKERDSRATLSVEGPCELWNQELDISFNRPYALGRIPLFEYLYHEYAPTYGGDVATGLCHPEVSLMKHAMICVYGQQNCVGIGEAEYDFEVNPQYPALLLLRNICEAQRTFAHDYLVFGQMLRPSELEVAKVAVDRYLRPGTVDIPRVMHAVWKSPQGDIGYVLVNWTGKSEPATLHLLESPRPKATSKIQVVSASEVRQIPAQEAGSGRITLTVSPRSVVLVKQS